MSNIWVTSDPHYWHQNILKFTKRPYASIEEMHEAFIEWNNQNVQDSDEVWNIGDISFGNIEQTISILKRLKGKQNLVLGNHDKKIKNNRSVFSEYFSLITTRHNLVLDKKTTIVMDHFPLRSWEGSNYGAYHFHGHTHGQMPPLGRSVDIGIDSPFITGQPEYRPYHIDEVIAFLKTQPVAKDYGD